MLDERMLKVWWCRWSEGTAGREGGDGSNKRKVKVTSLMTLAARTTPATNCHGVSQTWIPVRLFDDSPSPSPISSSRTPILFLFLWLSLHVLPHPIPFPASAWGDTHFAAAPRSQGRQSTRCTTSASKERTRTSQFSSIFFCLTHQKKKNSFLFPQHYSSIICVADVNNLAEAEDSSSTMECRQISETAAAGELARYTFAPGNHSPPPWSW